MTLREGGTLPTAAARLFSGKFLSSFSANIAKERAQRSGELEFATASEDQAA